jgi:hypothetical protein
VSEASHESVTVWSPPKLNVTVHPVSAVVPVSLTVTAPTKPPDHELSVEYVAEQVAVAPVAGPAAAMTPMPSVSTGTSAAARRSGLGQRPVP